MKTILTLILFVSTSAALSQKRVAGKYYHNFGYELILKADSTYEFSSHFDLSSSWSHGKWAYNADTIFLLFIPVYDTLRVGNDSKNYNLVLSADQKSESIDSLHYVASVLSAGGQNRKPNPLKLFFKRNSLYELKPTGEIVVKNMYDPILQKYFTTKYNKSKK